MASRHKKKNKHKSKKKTTDRDADGIRIGRWEKEKFQEAIRETLK